MAKTYHEWMRKAEESGARADILREVAERLNAVKQENRELRQANEILRRASAYSAPSGAGPAVQAMIAFISDHRQTHGVEPICR